MHKFTLGIEEEFQVLDSDTYRLRSQMSKIIDGGKVLLQEARQAWCAARQQQKADTSRQTDIGFMFLDFLGRAPFLPSDGKEQLVLKRVAHWKCNPVMSFNVEV